MEPQSQSPQMVRESANMNGISTTDSHIEFKHGAKFFVAMTIITVIEAIFLVCTSYVFISEYYSQVKNTYDKTTHTYTITEPFMYLYYAAAVSTIIFPLWLVYFVIWLIYNCFSDP